MRVLDIGPDVSNFMKTRLAAITIMALLSLAGWLAMAEPGIAGSLPEYAAAEAKKHIGETARVTGKVGCVLANRGWGYNVGLGDCDAQTPFWVVTHGDISGPKLDVSELNGVVVTVTGKIDNESGVPRIFVKSTSQIVPQGRRNFSELRVPRADEQQAQSAADAGNATKGDAARLSDTEIKEKLLGYWKSPRHGCLIKADGIMDMLPHKYATSTNRWDIRNGIFYQDGSPYQIVSLTDKKFVYRDSRGTYILTGSSKEQADPD
jgi:hypothetical protein